MKVTVQFFGQARRAAGRERTVVDVPAACTAPDAVRAAIAGGGEALRAFLFDGQDQPRRSILLIAGQRQVSWDSTEPLSDGDCLTILPPIAGG
jgi:molybdopterin converting factor small subunit